LHYRYEVSRLVWPIYGKTKSILSLDIREHFDENRMKWHIHLRVMPTIVWKKKLGWKLEVDMYIIHKSVNIENNKKTKCVLDGEHSITHSMQICGQIKFIC